MLAGRAHYGTESHVRQGFGKAVTMTRAFACLYVAPRFIERVSANKATYAHTLHTRAAIDELTFVY